MNLPGNLDSDFCRDVDSQPSPVWPDDEVKSSPNFSKGCTNISHSWFYLKGCVISKEPKKSQCIWAIFETSWRQIFFQSGHTATNHHRSGQDDRRVKRRVSSCLWRRREDLQIKGWETCAKLARLTITGKNFWSLETCLFLISLQSWKFKIKFRGKFKRI